MGHPDEAQIMVDREHTRGPSNAQRYREKNKEILAQKARERMARRRASIRELDTLQAQYQDKARQHSARYCETHTSDLAQRQVIRCSKVAIAKVGYKAWHEGYKKRNPPLELPPSEPLSDSDADIDPVLRPRREPEPDTHRAHSEVHQPDAHPHDIPESEP
ncbi:hypothetical protein C8R46DRAFT_1223174 [Mycena filopes]|nr:hypothetical protein C8R46DRAFT_1223174 [Mycena filopes]